MILYLGFYCLHLQISKIYHESVHVGPGAVFMSHPTHSLMWQIHTHKFLVHTLKAKKDYWCWFLLITEADHRIIKVGNHLQGDQTTLWEMAEWTWWHWGKVPPAPLIYWAHPGFVTPPLPWAAHPNATPLLQLRNFSFYPTWLLIFT